jgi:hypothetical protein
MIQFQFFFVAVISKLHWDDSISSELGLNTYCLRLTDFKFFLVFYKTCFLILKKKLGALNFLYDFLKN